MAKSKPTASTANENSSSTRVDAVASNGVKVKRKRKSVPRDSPMQRSSIYRGVTRFTFLFLIANIVSFITFPSLKLLAFYRRIGIDGRDDSRRTCGTRIAGMNLRIKKEDKVSISSLSLQFPKFTRFVSILVKFLMYLTLVWVELD